jgi:hypothetical protein
MTCYWCGAETEHGSQSQCIDALKAELAEKDEALAEADKTISFYMERAAQESEIGKQTTFQQKARTEKGEALAAPPNCFNESHRELKANIAELERGLRHWPDELREDCEDCQIIIRVKKEAPRP